MKAIKDPSETRKIEGYKKPELTITELLIKYDNGLRELSHCQCGSNSECYESMKENIKIIFGGGVGIERIEQIIKMAIEKKRPDVFEAELSRIEFENEQKFQKLIKENKFKEIVIFRGDKCETASVNSKEIIPEEIQKRCNMMSDYMSEIEGPEEDETREPRPDEPEEYWREKKCKLIEFIKYETYEQMKKESKSLKATEYDLGYMQGLCCIRNLLYETEVNEWGKGFFAGIKKAIEVIEYKPNIERDLNVYYAENQYKIQNIMGKTERKEEVK